MGEGAEPSKTLCFGAFQVDLRAGELRRSGLKVRLQEQPFRVLGMLLERPGKVVMREELKQELWPGDTFVDFDNGLNTAINKIREALGDSAETSRYVETLPRRGYRFIAPVEAVAAEPAVHLGSRAVTAGLSRQSDGMVKRLARRALLWVLAGLIVGALVSSLLFWKFTFRAANEQPIIRFTVAPPENTEWDFGGWMDLSPDGRQLAFVARAGPSGLGVLWIQSFDALRARPIQGTEGAAMPFWSPDDNYLGFYAGGKLWKVAISGGPPQALCEASGPGGIGATWNRGGVIVFASHGRLYRVSGAGGAPALVATPNASRHEQGYRLPQFLPDGRHFLFTVQSASPDAKRPYSVALGSLDSRKTERLLATGSNALYALPGNLLYMQGSTLMVRPFDAGRLAFNGQALPIAEKVRMVPLLGYGNFAVSQTGVLAYRTGTWVPTNKMVWLSRKGQKLGTIGQPGVYTNPALSPDGTKLAVEVGQFGEGDIWVYDLKRGTASRFNSHPADDLNPVWSGDGGRIIFTSTRRGQRDLYQKSANGLGSTKPLFVSEQQAKSLHDLSPDGHYAIYGAMVEGGLWILPLFGELKPLAFVKSQFHPHSARFSPTGRYIAYASGETGTNEIYVQTFPQHRGKWQISTNGGMEPMWRQDQKELFFLTPDDKMMAVNLYTDSGKLRPGVPRMLFQTHLIGSGWRNRYVVSPDGQHFLMLVPAGEAKPEPINVVLNWPALLKKQ